jgi:UDP-N-acetylglucosamine acyltransferase
LERKDATMAANTTLRLHPTAIISPAAELAPDVEVGPFAIIEGPVQIESGCRIHARAHLIGPLRMGENNEVFPNAILGGRPQHLGYKGEPTSIEIGDSNVFRENVTVHRGTTHSWVTRIGNNNLFMVGCHIAHDCKVGNRCILTNNSLLAGHCEIEDNVYLSGNAAIHQFVKVGRLAFISGLSASTKDVPPFIIQQNINEVHAVNLVGMRRAGFTSTQIDAVRRLYHIVYLQGLALPNALTQVMSELGHVDVAREFVQFVKNSKRGICAAPGRKLPTGATRLAEAA